jgi:hypothetical protein
MIIKIVSTQAGKHMRRIALVACVLLLAVGPVRAISLSEYREQVKRAVTALDSLAQTDEEESTFDYAQRSAGTVQAVREVLPRSQTVDWDGTTFNVDNGWLHEELDKLSKIQQAEHARTIERIKERLQSVSERLTETQAPGGSLDKSRREPETAGDTTAAGIRSKGKGPKLPVAFD